MKKLLSISHEVTACDCGCGKEIREKETDFLGQKKEKQFINELHMINYYLSYFKKQKDEKTIT